VIGATVGQRYRILRFLGKGGMGTVYEADPGETQERVAIKLLHSHLLDPGGEARRRFAREAEVARSIRSDHVARVLDAGTCERTGHAYLVTEYLEGEDLQRLLDRTGPLAPASALRIARQALVGLRDAHAARVVHRDIKPANLFLSRGSDGAITVKILDFGIAKLRADPLGATLAAGLTTTGGMLGSPLYMSPEQVQSSKDVDSRTDLWSLGSVLYAALVGRAPHEHLASLGQVLVAVCVSPAPRVREVAPWVPAEVAEVVHRAIEIRAEARYASAAEMLVAIARLAPASALREEDLLPCGEQPRPAIASTMPPSPLSPTPRSAVALEVERHPHANDTTPPAARAWEPRAAFSTTLPSGEGEHGGAARSEVPTRAGGRYVTVDPRRLLGAESELWTFSLDVHKHASSVIARVWKALRRAGAEVPSMSYGKRWALVEARTGKAIVEVGEDMRPLSVQEAGLRAGAVLWVVALETLPPQGTLLRG
jgi:serine/threonine-protein kinase